MDKRYYYRLLGVREGASTADIKKAYDRHMRRLSLPDYADDPEYVARKKDQMRHAYSILVGGAAPATAAQDKARFEKRKAAEDAGEDAIGELKKAFRKHTQSCEPVTEFSAGLGMLKEKLRDGMRDAGISMDHNSGKKTYYSPSEKRERDERKKQTRLVKIVITCMVGFSLFSSVLGACGNLFMNVVDEFSNDYYIMEENTPAQPETLSGDAANWMDHIIQNSYQYDYYSWLDMSSQNTFRDQVEWEPGEDTQDEIWSEMTDLASYLGLYSNSDIIWYLTGDENFYWETDDYGNAQIMTMLMEPPTYEEIAGSTNLYSGEVILNYADYLRFLGNVAEAQTEDVMGSIPELY